MRSVAAERAGLSVSAWITRSAVDCLRIEDGLVAVAEWETEHGAFTAADLTQAAAELAGLDAQMVGNAKRQAG